MNAALLTARKAKGLTQEQVAEAVGIDRTAYCRIENSRRCPVDTALRIAELLGVKVEDIFLPANVHEEHNEAATLDTGTEG